MHFVMTSQRMVEANEFNVVFRYYTLILRRFGGAAVLHSAIITEACSRTSDCCDV